MTTQSCLYLGGLLPGRHCSSCGIDHNHIPLESELQEFLIDEGIGKGLASAFLRAFVFDKRCAPGSNADYTTQCSCTCNGQKFTFRANLLHVLVQVTFLKRKGLWHGDDEEWFASYAAEAFHVRSRLKPQLGGVSGGGVLDLQGLTHLPRLQQAAAKHLRTYLDRSWFQQWIALVERHGASARVQQGSVLWQPPAHQQQDKGFLAQLVGRVFEAGSAFPVQGIVPCIALAAGVEPDGLRVSMAHLVHSDGYLSEMVLDNERTSPAWRALISGKLNVEDLPELQTSIGLCTAVRVATVAVSQMRQQELALHLVQPSSVWLYPGFSEPFTVDMPYQPPACLEFGASTSQCKPLHLNLHQQGCKMGGFRLVAGYDVMPTGFLDSASPKVLLSANPDGTIVCLPLFLKPQASSHAPSVSLSEVLLHRLVGRSSAGGRLAGSHGVAGAPTDTAAAPVPPPPPDPDEPQTGIRQSPCGAVRQRQASKRGRKDATDATYSPSGSSSDSGITSSDGGDDCSDDTGCGVRGRKPASRGRAGRRGGSNAQRKSTRQSSAAPARRTRGPAKRGRGMGPTGARVLSPTRDRVAQRLITPPTYVAEPPENPAVSISSIAELYPYKQMPCGNWSFSPPAPKQFAVTARVLNNLAKRAAAGESAAEEDLRSAEKMVCLVLGLDYAEVSRDGYNKSEHAWRRRFIINIVDRLSAMQPEVKNTFPTYWSKSMEIMKDMLEYPTVYKLTETEVAMYGSRSAVATSGKALTFIERLQAGAVQRRNYGRTREGRQQRSAAAAAVDVAQDGADTDGDDDAGRGDEPAAAAGGTEAPPDLARGVDGELHFPPTAAADEAGAGGAAGAQAADTSPHVQPASRSRGRSRLGTAGGRLPSSPAAVAGDAVASEAGAALQSADASPRVQEPAAAAGGTEAPPDLARGVDGELHFPPAAAADEHGAGGAAGAQAADTSPRVQEPAAAAGGTEAPPDLARGVDGELHFPPAAAADEHGAGGAAGAQAADTSPRVQPASRSRGRSRLGTAGGRLPSSPAAVAGDAVASEAGAALQSADASPRVQEPAAAAGGTEAPPDLARGVDGELHFPPAAAADEHGAGGAAGAQAADTSPRVQEPAAAAGGTEAPPDLARGVDGELHFPPAAAADEHGAGGAAGAQAADTSPRVQEPAAAAGGTEAPPDLARGVDGELHFPPTAAADEAGAGGAAGAQAADTSPHVQPASRSRGRSRLGTAGGRLPSSPAAVAGDAVASEAGAALQSADASPRVQEPAAAAGGTEAPPDLARGVDGELHFPPAAAADEHGAGGAAGAQAADTSPRVQEPAAAAGGTEAPPDLARGVDGELHFPPAAAADEHGAGGAAGAQAADTSPRVQEPAAAAGGTEAPPDLARGVDGELHFPPAAAADEHGAGGAAGAQAADTSPHVQPASRSRGRSRLGTAGGRLPSSPAAVAGDAVASEAGAALQSADASPRVQEPAAAAGGTEAPPDLARGVDGELHFPPAAAADEHGAGGAAGAQAADTSPRVQEPAAAAGGTEAPPDLARGVDGELHFPPAAAADEHGAGGAAGAQAADTSPRVQEPAAAAGGTEAPPDLARGVDGELHFPPAAAADEHGAGGAAGAQAADTSPRVQEPAAAAGGTEAPPDLARGVDGELHFPPAAAADEHGAGGAAGAQAADTSPRVQEPAAAAGGTEAPPDLARGVDGELHFPPAAAADEHGAGGAAGAQAADTSPRVQEPAAAAGGTEAPPDLARGVDGELHFPPAAAADEHGAGGAAGAQAADTSPRVQEPAAAAGGTEAPPDLARGVDGELHFPPAAAADEHGAGGAAGAQAADTSPRVQEPAAAAGGTEAPPDLARGVDGELHFPPAAAADEHGAGGAAGAQAADTSPRVQEPAAAAGGTEAPPDLARGVDGELHFPPAAAADEHGAGGAAGAQAADTSPRVQATAGTPAAGVQALLSQLLDSDGVVRLSAIGSNADLLITASYQLVGEVLAPKVLKPASEAIQAVHSRWPHMENRLGGGANGGPGLYGTLACKGISTVFALLVLLTGMCSYSVLVDPGAGLGRALVHAVLLGLRRAWGFELDAGRASQAVGACCKTLCRSFLKSHGKYN
ncbi:hypothetical protein PLESTF_000183900 [Pleodorina starrii]|nr:hypothetical protein PLESTF_000183900 [Pleodorina starrii]